MPPPNTPNISRTPSPHRPSPKTPRQHLVDLRAVEYIREVNENLLCPICRVALIEPVTTKCDHVFCRECFTQAWRTCKSCPVDRVPLNINADLFSTTKIILNQLDGLEVHCINAEAGCSKVVARSMLQNHVDKYCDYSLVPCPKETCNSEVLRKDSHTGCQHWIDYCPDCNDRLEHIAIANHREKECLKREVLCSKCGANILRCHFQAHKEECPEALTSCQWESYGCSHHCKRKDLQDHYIGCGFRILGPVAESLKKELSELREKLTSMEEKDRARESRIKFLETERSMALTSNATHLPEIAGFSADNPEWQPYDSRDQYLLSLLESQENKVDQLSQGMTELEAKQTMMLFNETIPIKEQLAEMRSAQSLVSMHVRWLMNFRLQERRPTPAGGPAVSGETLAADVAGPSSIRRLSDSTRENITKL